MLKKSTYIIFLVLILAGCSDLCKKDVLDLVNPFIGTGGHGHTFPGAAMPFGMVQLSPDTRIDNWDACSGYHYSDSVILGFSHTHLSGTGVGDYGDIRFMPSVGKQKFNPGNEDEEGYRSVFSHKTEVASPGYYKVYLEDYNITAEMTATNHCGMHRYIFPESSESNLLIDLKESVMTEKILELSINIINDHEISGYRKSSGWADNQVIFFHAIFSKPFEAYHIVSDGEVANSENQVTGKDIKAYVSYSTNDAEEIMVKVGISAVNAEGAKKNLAAEIPGWDFNLIREKAKTAWRDILSRIEVKGSNHSDLVKFYTALYHCCLAPNLFSDIDGMYRGHDGSIHKTKGNDVYTVFSLWDTYRALHPLMTIIQQARTNDFISTFLDITEKGNLLPVWELAGNETNCMIGYHAVPVIADAYIKGIRGYDIEQAYSAMIKSASQDHFGLKYYKEFGYIPAETEGESVSKTLEYAYDDWCIAMMAKQMGKEDDYRYFLQRAQSYKNIFDPDTKFIRGKRNGMFTEPFDPAEVNFMLTEANTWQYTFYVPQDISGMMNLMGGRELFEKKLDEMFHASTELSGREQSDITGLIGQYAHGNEPSHHMAYLYDYVGKPEKTQKLVRQIMNELYGEGPDGLCGNEDCGQMSAWFVLSAMGFYPVTPGIGYYAIGSPLFKEVTIHLENGKDFIIKGEKNDESNIYIQSASLNGTDYSNSFISHEQILQGGSLKFRMGSEQNEGWGKSSENIPVSTISENLITPVPYFQAESNSFQDSTEIRIRHLNENARIFYSSNGEKEMIRFTNPIVSTSAVDLAAKAIDDNGESQFAYSTFHKIHNDWQISIQSRYNDQYTAGGDLALIDGQRGGPNFRTGSWQGYEGVDFEAIIDMGKSTPINRVTASFLQDQRSWIFMPESVEYYISSDNNEFRKIGSINNDIPDNAEEASIKDFELKVKEISGRYIKVKAINRSVCPPWHVGAGSKAWLFIDEISIE
jgi:predicted alpha-1,2-mannosidase